MTDERLRLEAPVFPLIVTIALLIECQTDDSAIYIFPFAGKDMAVYRKYMKDQVRELLTNYGKIDVIWLDYSFPTGKHGKGRADWQSEKLMAMIRRISPKIIINNRLDLPAVMADIHTPEQIQPTEWVKIDGDTMLIGNWTINVGLNYQQQTGNHLAIEAAAKAVNGKVEDKNAFMKALRSIRVDTCRGPVAFDAYGNVVGSVYIRKVERKEGRLVNSVIHTYPNVSQFWTYDAKQFLANPVYSLDYPPAKNLEP